MRETNLVANAIAGFMMLGLAITIGGLALVILAILALLAALGWIIRRTSESRPE